MAGSVTMTGLSITGKETVDPASAGGEAPSQVARSRHRAHRRDREGRAGGGGKPVRLEGTGQGRRREPAAGPRAGRHRELQEVVRTLSLD